MAPFGDPIDPRYTRFKAGFDKWIIDKVAYPGLRWNPALTASNWYTYPLDKHDYIDFGQAAYPESPLDIGWDFDEGARKYRFKFFAQSSLPTLFAAIDKAYAAIAPARPWSVWNPYDGSWRQLRTKQASPPPPQPKNPGQRPKVPGALQERIDVLDELLRTKQITDEIYKERLRELLREYT
jgi:hypothetical protein